jgi:hypothetical protein
LSAIDGARLFFAQALQRAHAAAIFFDYGFAIHGSNDISRLGGPPSHGCVRLHPGRDIVRTGRTQRTAQHADRDFEPERRRTVNSPITLLSSGHISCVKAAIRAFRVIRRSRRR